MKCNNCGSEIINNDVFCGKCGARSIHDAPPANVGVKTTAMSRVFTAPNYLFFGLYLFHLINYLSQGNLLIGAIARSIGVNFIPLIFGIIYIFSGKRWSKIAYLIVTGLFIAIFIFSALELEHRKHQ